MSELEQLYLSMRHGIRSVVAQIVSPDDVEDIVQETYIRLRRVVAAGEIRHPRSYLYQTARNLALDSIKRADNALTVSWDEGAHHTPADGASVGDSIDSRASFEHFCDSVERLPDKARHVFVMKKVYGFSQREIATDLGISESTVEKHVSLGARRCARYMREQDVTAQQEVTGASG